MAAARVAVPAENGNAGAGAGTATRRGRQNGTRARAAAAWQCRLRRQRGVSCATKDPLKTNNTKAGCLRLRDHDVANKWGYPDPMIVKSQILQSRASMSRDQPRQPVQDPDRLAKMRRRDHSG